MVKDIEIKGKVYYKCESCNFIYKGKKTAQECEQWCMQNKSCNIEIVKRSVKL